MDQCIMGRCQNHVRSGHGEMIYPDGEEYEGCWENDKRHNLGFIAKLKHLIRSF